MGDFLTTAAITGGNSTFSLAIMGSGAAADTTIAAKDRGLTDGQAFALGTVAGIAEIVTEYVSLEALLNPDVLMDSAWKYVVKNMLAEGSEEVGSDAINLIADILISKDQSEWQQSIDYYMTEEKMSQERAFARAMADQAATMGLDWLGGAISGGTLGSLAAIDYKVHTSRVAKQIKGMNLTDADVQAFIDSGLESGEGTASYQLAKEMQNKLDSGKKLSDYDVARLCQANAAAVQAEEADRSGEYEETDPVAGDTSDTDRGESNRMHSDGETSAMGMAEEAGMRRDATAATFAEEVNRQLTQNLYGGMDNGSIYEQAGDTEKSRLRAGDGVPDGGLQRYDGTGAGEQAGGVATGAAVRRNGTDRGREIVALQNYARHLRLKKVSSQELGLHTGTEARTVQVMPRENWNGQMQQIAERIYNETGKNVTFVMGRMQIRGADGRVNYARGAISGDNIFVQADNMKVSMEQLADHEAYHAKAGFTDGRLNNEIRQHIMDTFSEEEFQKVLDQYIIGMRGIVDISQAQTGEDYEAAIRLIEEEVFADAYAGINAFGANTARFAETVNEKMDQLYMGKQMEQENGTRQTNGPNGEKMSVSEAYGQEIDAWNAEGRPEGEQFVLGSTGEVLQGLGAIESDIYINGDKVNTILREHSEMTLDEIKRIPEILDDPVLILKSRNVRNVRNNTRLVILGSVKAQNGQPVLCILDLLPIENNLVINDLQKVVSSYTKDNAKAFIEGSDVLYVDKKRTTPLLRSLGFYNAQRAERSGYIGSISYSKRNVNINGVPFSKIYDQAAPKTFEEEVQRQIRERFSYGGEQEKGADLNAGTDEEMSRRGTGWKREMEDSTSQDYSNSQKGLQAREIAEIQGIGRKSVNDFTSEDIQKTERFARRYWNEMGVKSPFFRAWFGDWRAYDNRKITISDVSHSVSYKAGKATNKDTGRLMSWGSDFIRETVKHQRSGGIASSIVGNVESIVENAVLLDSVVSTLSSKTKMPGTAFMHSFYSMVNDGNVLALVKLYAEEAVSLKTGEPFTRAYDLKDIAIVATSANGVHPKSGSLTDANIATVNTVADLFADVKRRDKNFNPKPVNNALLNEDGTPKMFYHGTSNGGFTVFDAYGHGRFGLFGIGSYFTENPEVAQGYTQKRRGHDPQVYQVYLHVENPIDMDANADIRAWKNAVPDADTYFSGCVTNEDCFRALKEYCEDEMMYRYEAEELIMDAIQEMGHDGITHIGGGRYNTRDDTRHRVVITFEPEQVKSATDNVGTFDGTKEDIRYSVDDSSGDALLEEDAGDSAVVDEKPKPKVKTPAKKVKPVAESKPIIAKRDLKNTVFNLFSVPEGQRTELGRIVESYADRLVKNGRLTEEDRQHFFDRMYESGMMTVPADDYMAEGRRYIKGGKIYVPDSVVAEFGDDWNNFRRQAFGAGVMLTRDRGQVSTAGGIDMWNAELARELPGLFDAEETDRRSILERIVQVAEEGKDERMSLPEYTSWLAGREGIAEDEFLDNMERQLDWALRTFAEKAHLEMKLRDRTGVKIAQEREGFAEKSRKQQERQRAQESQRRAEEREARKDSARRQREKKELRELQERTLKTMQWLSKNRNRAPEELKAEWDEVLGDIDLFAVSAADEMRWSDKHNATWKDLAQMYKDAQKNDPNFLPSKELERIVTRLDATKIGEMDIGALQDLYKAAIGLRTEFYNRNNVINDEMNRLFAEVYTDAKREIESAPGGYTGKAMDKLFNLEQPTPMNLLQRMGGWDPDGTFYSMAKQLEGGERDIRAFKVKAARMLENFLDEHQDWVKKADGQGKDGIWYEVEIPELVALELGKKPKFGDTIKVSMTPAQKVHMYLESKNQDNLRHMTGGRTFVNKELYSQGKRQEALSQGKTIRMAPETVKALVSDMTEEEMELARLLDQYYNTFATKEINRVSNILYGYDKAMGKNYAPIYTNRNYTKTEFGVFDVTAEGVGNMKGRQYAVNPSYNISALDAFERHVDQTARFVGMAIPARNWTTLMNWREKNNSTGDVITHKWGEETKRYITDLITTLQGGDLEKSDSVSAFANKAMSTYISAVFGANPSIVLKQLGSIPMAGAYLDFKNFPTVSQIKSIDQNLIAKYSQDLAWRTMGYSMPETKQLKENPNWTQTNKTFKFVFGGGAITAMDGWAASVLWPWAENKVRQEFPNLEVGTQAQIDAGESQFYKKVAEEFENAMARSQSTSDEIHQSSLRKSKNPITRAFTLFRSDSAQTYNVLRQKIGEVQYYARTGADDQVLQTAKKAAGAAFCAMLLNAAWSEVVSFLMALWKHKDDRYRDDEDEMTAGSVTGEMVSGMIGSIAGTVTGGEELYEIIGNILTGEKWYGIDTPGMEQLNDVVDTIMESGGELGQVMKGAVDVLKNGGDLGAYFASNSGKILGGIKDISQTAATYLTGLPVTNLEAYLMGTVKTLSPALGEAYDGLFKDSGKQDLAALEGDALMYRVKEILRERKLTDSKETAEMLAGLYANGYKGAVPPDVPGSVSIDGETYELGEYQKQAYGNIWNATVSDGLDELISSDVFENADEETREKMLKYLYNYASDRAKAELFDDYEMKSGTEENTRIVAAGASVADCVIWNTVTGDMNGGEKAELLAEWDLPEEAKREIFLSDISDADGTVADIQAFEDAGHDFDDFLRAYGKYEDYVIDGMEPELAENLYEEMEQIVPEDGKNTPTNLQAWRASVDFSDDVNDQLAALDMVMSDSQIQKVEIACSFGVTPDSYVRLQEIKAQYDADGNGSYTHAEIRSAINSMVGLSTKQKAVLWQLATGATSAKNNPYDRSVGQKVLDEREKAKEKSSAGSSSSSSTESADTFSDEVMRQLMANWQ